MYAMNEQHNPSPIPSTSHVSEETAPAPQSEPEYSWVQHGWQVIKQSPLPLAALVLLASSLILWLSGYRNIANWALLAIIVIGAVPLLWETIHQFLRKEFGVDVIAILAIGGSLLLGKYLAGALIVLMLSGGEALEAYALRRARSSLSALAERAPRLAHLWRAGVLVNIPAEEVDVGMEVMVKPGELVPVDGVVTAGTSRLSEADLTGEPVPKTKRKGEQEE